MKHVLVTGGAGFIGSHIVDAYVERGYRVSVVDNLSTGDRRNVNPRADFVEADIREVCFRPMQTLAAGIKPVADGRFVDDELWPCGISLELLAERADCDP